KHANQDPFEIAMMFLPVDDSEERITQSIEEQTPDGLAALKARVTELDPAKVTVLPGSIYPRIAAPTSIATNYRCTGVRVAGMDGGNKEVLLFPPAPTINSFNPHSSNTSISSNETFSA